MHSLIVFLDIVTQLLAILEHLRLIQQPLPINGNIRQRCQFGLQSLNSGLYELKSQRVRVGCTYVGFALNCEHVATQRLEVDLPHVFCEFIFFG